MGKGFLKIFCPAKKGGIFGKEVLRKYAKSHAKSKDKRKGYAN